MEAAFIRGTVSVVLRPHLFSEIHDQLIPSQRTRYKKPFLAAIEDQNQLAIRDVIQHLIRSGMTKSWIQLDTVVGYARSFLRDWAHHRQNITPTTDMGQLFTSLYPDGISHQGDPNYIEDAAAGEEHWEEAAPVDTPMDEDAPTAEREEDAPPEEEEEGEEDAPLSEPSTLTIPQGRSRTETPEDERLDYS